MQKYIICPNCGKEYFPGEIYLPKYFLGQPKQVERDVYGKIVYNEGIDQDTNETFVCDECNKKFKVWADINYNVTLDERTDFNTDYISKKLDDRIFLNED